MKNKTFLITLAALMFTFGGIVACSETNEVEDTKDTPVLVEPEVEVEKEDETLEDLDQKIEDPELQDPNVKFDENLEVYDDWVLWSVTN